MRGILIPGRRILIMNAKEKARQQMQGERARKLADELLTDLDIPPRRIKLIPAARQKRAIDTERRYTAKRKKIEHTEPKPCRAALVGISTELIENGNNYSEIQIESARDDVRQTIMQDNQNRANKNASVPTNNARTTRHEPYDTAIIKRKCKTNKNKMIAIRFRDTDEHNWPVLEQQEKRRGRILPIGRDACALPSYANIQINPPRRGLTYRIEQLEMQWFDQEHQTRY